MKLFWKMLFGILVIFLLTFPLFGTILLRTSFRTALEREKENGLEELPMFQYSILYTVDEGMIRTLAESAGKNILDNRYGFCIYHDNGVSIYPEGRRAGELWDTLKQKENSDENCLWEMTEEKGVHVLKAVVRMESGGETYGLEVTRNIQDIYDGRKAMYHHYRESRRLEKLSYKMMELIGLGKGNITLQPVKIRDLLGQLEKTTGRLLQEKKITLCCEAREGIVEGDFDLLLSLLANLVDNGRKACHEGGHISIKGQCQAHGQYQITVTDDGNGIPEEELGKITEAFYMVDKSRARREGGAGLGMAICERIVKLHGAAWKIESTLGEGTVVTLFFRC